MSGNKRKWTKVDIPSQKGKLVIVTGAASGMGYEIALGLAEAEANVVLVDRNEEAGIVAMEKIRTILPQANISFEKVDLGNLESIKEFCEKVNAQKQAVDILVNNAGICDAARPNNRRVTTRGFEAHFGINYLGHFALVAQLLPSLRRSKEARVVNVGSLSYKYSKINFGDLQMEKGYTSMKAYAQSKLATMLFSHELRRRSEAGSWGLRVVSCHPGFAATTIAFAPDNWYKKVILRFGKVAFQDAATGALPALFSSAAPEAQNGGYYGPTGRLGIKGPVGPVSIKVVGQDTAVASKLWDVSNELTRVYWP